MGEKYGSIRVPGEVESAEFEMILDAAVEAGLDTRILEEWYCRDENSVPPAYYLKPKAEMLKNYQNSVRMIDSIRVQVKWRKFLGIMALHSSGSPERHVEEEKNFEPQMDMKFKRYILRNQFISYTTDYTLQ